MSDDQDSLLQFPCKYPIKVMGYSNCGLDIIVVSIVRKHSPTLTNNTVSTKKSRTGKYESITITIEAQSKQQIEDIYQELTAHDKIVMVL